MQLELIEGLPAIGGRHSIWFSIDALSDQYCGGMFAEGEAGWGLDIDSLILHYYGYMDSVAICGHLARPAEIYGGDLDELYHDDTETWYDAHYCPECLAGLEG